MKKFLQTMLLILVVTIMPIGATAQEAEWGASATEISKSGSLKDAILDAKNGHAKYIRLLASEVETLGTAEYLIDKGEFTLDLNGKRIYRTSGYLLSVLNSGTHLTIIDSAGGGKVCGNTSSSNYAINVYKGAKVTIKGGTYYANGGAYVVYIQENSTVDIMGGTFKSYGASYTFNNGGYLNILGGTIESAGTSSRVPIYCSSNSVTTITEGSVGAANTTVFKYVGGVLDLTNAPSIEGKKVLVYNKGVLKPGAETIVLPDIYGFYDKNNIFVEELAHNNTYTINLRPDVPKYTMTFDGNGGSGEMVQEFCYGNYLLPKCTFTAPEGMMFKAWLVGDKEYQPGQVITVGGDTTIKAVWATIYTITFDANGGEGTMESRVTTGSFELPNCTFKAPEDKMFKAWLVGDKEYQPRETIKIDENTTVKAMWDDAKIVIKMQDSAKDGWHGAKIMVYKNGEEIGSATLETGDYGTFTCAYNKYAEYTFYWMAGLNNLPEMSAEIFLGDNIVLTLEATQIQQFEDNTLLHTLEAQTLKIEDGTLTEYNNGVTCDVVNLIYTRTLPNLFWNALYVPFDIPVEVLTDNYDVASINKVYAYDTNNDGTVDDMEMEIIKIDEEVLNANYPYLIRAKNEEAKEMNIELKNVTLQATVETSETYTSEDMEFTVKGIYSQMTADDLNGALVVTTDGGWQQLAAEGMLSPFRLYLTMTEPTGSVEAKSIRISLLGEDTPTSIEVLPTKTKENVMYDLQGRCVEQPTKGLYIMQGKKVILK